MRNGRRILIALLGLLCGLTLAACAGQRTPVAESPVLVVSGLYESDVEVGPLGRLQLNLVRRNNTQTIYDAKLSGISGADFGSSTGVGTIGNEHLILNFDRGKESDFYFQGMAQLSGETVTGIDGSFVFPDQTEQLTVHFNYTGPPIITPAS